MRQQHQGREAGAKTPLARLRLASGSRSVGFAPPPAGRLQGCILVAFALWSVTFIAQDYKSDLPADHPAIDYARRPVHNRVATLAAELARGTVDLKPQPGDLSYLPAVLDHLHLGADSQMLVFSKTSFQAPKIAPDHPRAIYFTDDVAVAYVPGAASIELSAVDPVQGPMFYIMTMDPARRPSIARSEVCLKCHLGPSTLGVPGIYVGSVIPGPTGAPLRDESAIITDHRSAFAERWGGWYVTAKRGEQRDRANAVAPNPADPETLIRESQQNLTNLIGRFNPSGYLTQTSDIVALMTFEHQTQMTNLITRVGWEARMMGDGEGSPKGGPYVAGHITAAELNADLEELVEYMLFGGEAPLKEPIEGVSSFTRTFSERGPKDKKGRSLRDFDLRTRLFRYPLSYLIYSEAFDALPQSVRGRIIRRINDVLSGKDTSARFAHLTKEDRRAIVEILRDTKPGVVPGTAIE